MLPGRLCLKIRGGHRFLRILIFICLQAFWDPPWHMSHNLSLGPMGLFKPKQDSLVRTLTLLVSDLVGKRFDEGVTLVNIFIVASLKHAFF